MAMAELIGEFGLATSSHEREIRHDDLVRDLLPRFDSREIEKSRRFLLLFERPIDAVRFGLAYHEAVADLAAELEQPLSGRIGIHVGEVFLRRNSPEHISRGAKPLELEGPARTTVARAMSLAAAGQTLITKAAYLLARRAAVGDDGLDEEVVWLSHDRYRFAGADEVLELFEVGARGISPLTAPRPPVASDPRRVTHIVKVEAETWQPAAGQPIPHRRHWTLERPLGEATYGELWLGKHRKTGDRHAFRFCHDAGDLPRMHHQLTVVRHLRQSLDDHQVAARTLDSQLDEAPYFLESEHLEADTLASWVEARGGLAEIPLETRLEVVARVADLLAGLHRVGVAVGNVRPINLLVHEASGTIDELLMADLSQARIVDVAATADTTVADRPDRDPTLIFYLPPEREEHHPVTREGDVYALGILLYQIVAGDFDRPLGPFWERDVDDPRLRREIAGLADPDPRARPADVSEVALSLRELGSRPAGGEQESREPAPERGAEAPRRSLLSGLLRRR